MGNVCNCFGGSSGQKDITTGEGKHSFEGRFNKFDDSQHGKGNEGDNGKDASNQQTNPSKEAITPKKKNPYEVALTDFVTLKVRKYQKKEKTSGKIA